MKTASTILQYERPSMEMNSHCSQSNSTPAWILTVLLCHSEPSKSSLPRVLDIIHYKDSQLVLCHSQHTMDSGQMFNTHATNSQNGSLTLILSSLSHQSLSLFLELNVWQVITKLRMDKKTISPRSFLKKTIKDR